VELPVWQTFVIEFMVTVGACFTITVCEGDVTEPQELLVVKVMEYVPGFIKLNSGAKEVKVVPFKRV
jgi:hypothetical protein